MFIINPEAILALNSSFNAGAVAHVLTCEELGLDASQEGVNLSAGMASVISQLVNGEASLEQFSKAQQDAIASVCHEVAGNVFDSAICCLWGDEQEFDVWSMGHQVVIELKALELRIEEGLSVEASIEEACEYFGIFLERVLACIEAGDWALSPEVEKGLKAIQERNAAKFKQ